MCYFQYDGRKEMTFDDWFEEEKEINPIVEAIKHPGWQEIRRIEKALKVLVDIGINRQNCMMDNKDNLIIPIREFQNDKLRELGE